MKLNVLVLIFLVEFVSYSTADEWKDLRKKLIALSILSGLRPIRKQYVLPLPLPLPLPFLISKISPAVVPTEKKFPVLVRKPIPIFPMMPKFLPVEPKKKKFPPPDYMAQESRLYPQFQPPNHEWDHSSWSHDSLFANSDSIPLSDLHTFHSNEPQELPIQSLNHGKKYDPYNFGDAQDDDNQDETTVKPKTKQPERKKNYRSNRSMSKLYDNYDHRPLGATQTAHFDDLSDYNIFGYPLNGDLLMSSTDSVKTKNPFTHRQTNANMGTKRSTTNSDMKEKASTNGNAQTVKRTQTAANKFKDGFPVTADEIKVILSDLKTLNDEIKVIPSGNVFARDPPLVNTGVKRVQVGEIRIRPKELSSLISSGGYRQQSQAK